jgi:hypothetical protein
MTTPQIAANAPLKDCPRCGRRMQILSTSASSYNYVCYAHTPQNVGDLEPYYFNLHFNSVNEDGSIKLMKGKEK